MLSPSRSRLREYANDPTVFIGDLVIPGADGPARFDTIWGDFQRETFEQLAPCLKAVARGERPPLRGFWLERTKGGSKDSDVGCCLLWLLLFTQVPLLIELGADKREQAAETLSAMRDMVRLNPWLTPFVDIQVRRIRGKRTKGLMDVLTTTEFGAHGSRPHVTVCNELSHVSKQAFMETMMDNASKIPGNLAIIATNAGFLDTWQHRWRETYRGNERWYFQKLSVPAPWLPDADIEEAKSRNSTSRFNRLWRGMWVAGKGDALDGADIDAAITRLDPMSPEEVESGNYAIVAGIDAAVRHDHAALVILAAPYRGARVRLVYVNSWVPGPDGKINLIDFEAAILQTHKDYGFTSANYDPTQMEFMAQRLEVAGVPMNHVAFTPANCTRMAHDLLAAFRGTQIELYDDSRLKADLSQLRILDRKWGYKLDAPSGEMGHADRAIALALALPTALICLQQDTPTKDEGAEHIIEV